MTRYKINYYFEKDFFVSRIIETESQAEAIQDVKDQAGMVEFTDNHGSFHRFDIGDIKLVSVCPVDE